MKKYFFSYEINLGGNRVMKGYMTFDTDGCPVTALNSRLCEIRDEQGISDEQRIIVVAFNPL